MAFDLNSMSAKELEALIAQANKRRAVLKKRKPVATVRKRLEQIARADMLFRSNATGFSGNGNENGPPIIAGGPS